MYDEAYDNDDDDVVERDDFEDDDEAEFRWAKLPAEPMESTLIAAELFDDDEEPTC